ncbi:MULTISPECIES: hypothetical protein [Methanocalculus]|uniref:hypothetical protein n=1 Tax=Methanocalculus TaxID=71151 RepID=UPI0020A04729|nr:MULTISPECIES: hypothetical protein [unclassified Methanocalculus]MCP1662871.1 hypothetical protein [Methanocalculus sp. AMF5]
MKSLSFLVLVTLLVAGVLVSGCMDREEVLHDTTLTLDSGKFVTYDLEAGTYWIHVTSDEKVDVAFDTASTYDRKGVTVYDQVITLGSAAKMKVENPGRFLGIGAKEASVTLKIVKNPANR